MSERPIHSVGLAGDGDEVAAIQDVERRFNIMLDYRDAPYWVTAGDVFQSVQKVLPPAVREAPDVWDHFAAVLTEQSGMDPSLIRADSPLLLPKTHVARQPGRIGLTLWIVTLASIAIGIHAALV